MAVIDPIADKEGGASTRGKVNAAIAQANAVPSKAAYADVAMSGARPGESGDFFATTYDGAPASLTPISNKLATAYGNVAVLNAARIVASIEATRVEQNRTLAARYVVRRFTDTSDPAGDAIRLGIRWLDRDFAGLSTTVLADLLNVTTGSGRIERSFIIGTAAGDGIDVVAPANAVYARRFVQTFGSDGVTHVEVLDLTPAADISTVTNVVAQKLDKAEAIDLDGIRTQSNTVAAAAAKVFPAIAEVTQTGINPLSYGFKGWAVALDVGEDVDAGDYAEAFSFDVTLSSTAVDVRLKVYSRPLVGPNENAVPGQVDDVLIFDLVEPLGEAGLVAKDTLQRAFFRFPKMLYFEEGRAYLFVIEAHDVSNALTVIGIATYLSSGYEQRRIGYYKNGAGVWQAISSSTIGLSWHLHQAELGDIATAQRAAQSMSPFFKADYSRPRGSSFDKSLNFRSWVAGVLAGTDIAVGDSFDSVAMRIDPSATAEIAILRVWRRLTSSAFVNSYPTSTADVLVDTVAASVKDLGLQSGVFQEASFNLRVPIEAEAGEIYLFQIDILDASGALVPFGVESATGTFSQQYRRGFYRNSINAATNVAAGFSICVSLGSRAYRPDYGDDDTSPFDVIDACEASADNGTLTVTIDAAASGFDRRGRTLRFGGSVTLTAPTTGAVTDEAVTIGSGELGYGSAASGALAKANISNVVVKDAATNAVLSEGVDYQVNYQHGKVIRVSAGTQAVKVSYSWSKRRYDLICVHPETLVLTVVAGTEADRDAQERLPVPSIANQVRLFFARVTANGVSLVPLWDAEDGRPRKYLPALQREIKRGRRHLRPILKMLENGTALTIAGYGDSIVGCPGIAASPTSPNGTTRDILGMFGSIGSDLTSALPLYDQGDGGGAIHHHASHIRCAIDVLTERFSSTITYLNFGIGGTTSDTAANNGRDATRLGALTESAAELVFIGFGMNELGSTTTVDNIVAIGNACLTAGKRVVIIGVPRPNVVRGTLQDLNWRYTNRALRRAALKLDVAFVDFVSLYDDDCISALGISPLDVCASNFFNHPGLNENRLLGALIGALFTD